MDREEINSMSFDEKLSKLRKGIRIPSPAEYKEMQELDEILERIEMIKRRLSRMNNPSNI